MSECLKVAITSIRERCLTNLAKSPEDPYLKKSAKSVTSLIKGGLPDQEDKTAMSSWIQAYAQATLDVTFYEENLLVQSEFPEIGGLERLNDLIDCLDTTERCLLALYEDEETARHIIGHELLECIHWRKGALNYMYCSTILENPERLLKSPVNFVKVCKDGVHHLQRMLNLRKPIAENRSEITTNDESALELVQNGVFSDTHMLALIYCGELCVWCTRHCGDVLCVKEKKDLGLQCLNLYSQMVSGPLKDKGWSSVQAIKYIDEMKI